MAEKRRTFLQSVAATAGLAMTCDPDAEALAATGAAGDVEPGPVHPARMPTLELGKHKVSRLIIGSNPIHGYSHFNRLLSNHMTDWSTPEQVCDMLDTCAKHGVNTWQFSHHDRGMRDLKAHRERGGKMQWILLSHREIEENHSLIKDVVKLSPIGIVHHGGSADRKRRNGQTDKIKDFLKAVRDSGTMVGLSTHDPEFLQQAEDEDWDIDFYMASLYHRTRTDEELREILGTRPLGEMYIPEDPPRMCEKVRQTEKPCLMYKVLAAGRQINSKEQIDRAFRFVLEHIKPNDGMIVGMYQKYSDQVAENATRVKEICGALKA